MAFVRKNWPDMLEVDIGDSKGGLTVKWRDSTLYFTAPLHSPKEVRSVGRPDNVWEQFWESLDRHHVWSWNSDYYNPDGDGLSWSITIKLGDRSIHSVGQNAYPPGGSSEPGTAFNGFFQALMKLCGREDFTLDDTRIDVAVDEAISNSDLRSMPDW